MEGTKYKSVTMPNDVPIFRKNPDLQKYWTAHPSKAAIQAAKRYGSVWNNKYLVNLIYRIKIKLGIRTGSPVLKFTKGRLWKTK